MTPDRVACAVALALMLATLVGILWCGARR